MAMTVEQQRALALARARTRAAQEPQYKTGAVEDYGKAVGSGLAEGAISLGGLPGDITTLIGQGAGKVAGLFGAEDETQKNVAESVRRSVPIFGQAPNTQEAMRSVNQLTGFEPYRGERTGAQYANTAASFVPAAAAFGAPGGVKAAVGSAIKYGVIPGLTSEAAGQATEGTKYEPYARIGGAVGGAMAAGGLTAAARWAMTPKDPAIQPIFDKANRLKQSADRLYKVVDRSGIEVDPLSLQAGVTRVKAKLAQQGLEAGLAPTETERALKILDNLAKEPATFRRLDAARRAIKNSFTYNNADEKRLATIMTRELDDFIGSLGPQDIISQASPATTQRALEQARSIWSRSASMNDKAEILDNIWQSALDKLGANYSKAGLSTAVRQELRGLSKRIRTNEELGRLFTKAEKDAITTVVRGGKMENFYRNIGKLAPVSPSSAAIANATLAPMTAGAGFMMGGGPTGAAIGAMIPTAVGVGVGAPARTAANILQRRELDKLVAILLNEGKPASTALPSRLSAPMVGFYGSRPLPSDYAAALSPEQPAR